MSRKLTEKQLRKRIKELNVIIRKQRKIIIKQKRIIRKQKKIIIRQIRVPARRIRKQAVINFRSDEAPYFVSIRAITINPDITERGLLMAINQVKSRLEYNLRLFSAQYLGYEAKAIPSSEDKQLNDFKIHIEVLIKRRANYFTI